jgi:type IV pilus assembly protein PilZ
MATNGVTTPNQPVPPIGAGRPSVIQLAIKEKAALYAAYIPLFFEGGVFVPTTRTYSLGDDVYLLLTLLEDTTRYPIAGKVAWITPPNVAGNRPQGIGVRFPSDDKARELKVKMEAALGTNLAASKPTHTV